MRDDHEFVRVELGIYDVVVEGVIVRRIARRDQIGRNTVKSFLFSGTGRHVGLWEGSVANAGLDAYDERKVRTHITRPKTSRETAAQHLLAAYEKAGVDLLAGTQ
jgi:hypothetical protein